MNVDGKFFFFIQELNGILLESNSLTAYHFGTEPDLRIAVVSWLHALAGRYHVTAWNLLYSNFLTLLEYDKRKQNLVSSDVLD